MISEADIEALKNAQDVAARVVERLGKGSTPQRMWCAQDEIPIARALRTFLRVTELQGQAIIAMDAILTARSTEAMQTYDRAGNPVI